jgi:hypothetical protein
MPGEYHRWGVTGIWNILHNNANGMQALSLDTPEGKEALASQPVGYVQWDSVASKAAISIHSPLPLDPQVPTPK